MKIVTAYDPKPIPPRQFDWSAADDGYEPGDPIGYGQTEAEAIEDLKRQIEDAADMVPNETHQRCFHCGVYADECQCDGGIAR